MRAALGFLTRTCRAVGKPGAPPEVPKPDSVAGPHGWACGHAWTPRLARRGRGIELCVRWLCRRCSSRFGTSFRSSS